MKKKILLCSIFHLIGFVMFVVGLALLHKISTATWLYGILASLGSLIFTSSIHYKNEK